MKIIKSKDPTVLKVSEIEPNEIERSSRKQLNDAAELFDKQTESEEKTKEQEEVAA